MFCKLHSERIATKKCSNCEGRICDECGVILKGKFFCSDCANRYLPGITLVPERDPFKAAAFSLFIPGLGQIYNGQLSKGMLIFFSCWLIIPWVYGIVDAFQTAQKINDHTVFSKLSIQDGVFFFIITASVLMAVIQVSRYYDSPRLSVSLLETDLGMLSGAIEKYKQEKGSYPLNFSQLYFADPPYATDTYCDTDRHGFRLSCDFSEKGYLLTAKPLSGEHKEVYTMATGGIRQRAPLGTW